MARVPPLIAPELSITTPGAFEPPVQVIAVAAVSVPPAWMVPMSLLLTVFGGGIGDAAVDGEARHGSRSCTGDE